MGSEAESGKDTHRKHGDLLIFLSILGRGNQAKKPHVDNLKFFPQ
jgi:hypothetical protein